MKNLAKFTILLLFVPSLALSEVTLEVNKTSQHIELKVCNTVGKKQVTYWGINIEKKEDERWKFFRGHIGCPCNAKCKRAPIRLKLNECATHRWDKKGARCVTAEKGIYRFVILGEGDAKAGNILGKSREFTIQ